MSCSKSLKFCLTFTFLFFVNLLAAKVPVNDSTSVVVLADSLNQATLGTQTGGQFVAGGGWQVTGPEDMIVYDLGSYIENGSLEITVRNFDPRIQNTMERHHFLSMYRNPWGNHHPVENLETVWNLHTGFRYSPGLKVLSWTYIEDESINLVPDVWDTSQTYQIKVVWYGKTFSYYRNGVLETENQNSNKMQLRYLFLGRDNTVSGDLITGFKHNQYEAMVGPIFSNLVVKEILYTSDAVPPVIHDSQVTNIYANAVRLSWQTNEPAICSVQYWFSGSDTVSTNILGPPDQIFSTVLYPLESGREYFYMISAADSSENQSLTGTQSFKALAKGLLLVYPTHDTFVENSGIYDEFRNHANFGWMSLLASTQRECYLRFQLSVLAESIRKATVRLHARQGGYLDGAVLKFKSSWSENNVTWLFKPFVSGPTVATIDSVKENQWLEIDVTPFVQAGDSIEFALLANGTDVISFDSRESVNFQPELILSTQKPAPKISSFSPASGPAGSQVTIFGHYFVEPLQVFLGKKPALSVTVLSDSILTLSVPTGSVSGTFKIINDNGESSSAGIFTVLQAPVVKSFSPTSGPAGTSILIRGQYFTGADSVCFNNSAAESFSVFSDSLIVAKVPEASTDGAIRIHNQAGSGSSSAVFHVIEKPFILSFQPESGVPGDTILIVGMHFSDVQTVRFAQEPANFMIENDDSISAFVPDNVTTGPLTVENPAGADTSTENFSVLQTMLRIISPNGGEILHAGDVFEITWNTVGEIDTVNIDISLNDGFSWLPVARNLINVGRFQWTVPGFASVSSRVKLFSDTLSDVSDQVFTIDNITGISGKQQSTENSFELLGNVPNPFNAGTKILYTIPEESRVQITLFSILGTRIRTLFDAIQDQGQHSVTWDGRDDNGRQVSSGVFFYRITVPKNTAVGKMLLLK